MIEDMEWARLREQAERKHIVETAWRVVSAEDRSNVDARLVEMERMLKAEVKRALVRESRLERHIERLKYDLECLQAWGR